MSEPFVGEIKLLGFNFNPRGYALCNGQTINVQQQAALFALLGTTYGGNGTSTFQLPNLQSRVPIGFGQGAGLSLYTLGEIGGAQQVALGITNLPPHNHVATTTVTPSSNLGATTVVNGVTGVPAASRLPSPTGNLLTQPVVAGGGGVVDAYAAPGAGTVAAMATGSATTTLTGTVTATGATTIGNTGSGIPVTTLPPFLAINYSIALVGVFPTRS